MTPEEIGRVLANEVSRRLIEAEEEKRRHNVRELIASSRNIAPNNNKEITCETLSKEHVLSLYNQGKLHTLDDEQTKSVLSFLGGTSIYTELAKLSTGDLVRCNVPIEMLTKAKDGSGMLGIIRDNNGEIIGQARFGPAGVGVVSPLIIFQVMSMVTGQYYMHTITKYLKIIDDKLSHIIELKEADLNAEMQQIINKLADYCGIGNSDFMDSDIDRLFRYEDFARKEINKYGDSIDILKNVSTELKRQNIIEKVNNNYDEVIKRFVNKMYFQYILVLVNFNLERAFTALNKPSNRISDVNNKFVLYYEAIMDTYYEFQRDQYIACRFVSGIMKFPNKFFIINDRKNKTNKMINEFNLKKNDIVVNNLLKNIKSIQLYGVFYIEKKGNSNFNISTISNEVC